MSEGQEATAQAQRPRLDPTTTEGWAVDEAVQAETIRRVSLAQAVDAEIRSLVQSRRLGRVRLCERLAFMRDEGLHAELNQTTFGDYAIAVGAARSHRAARQQADLWEQLQDMPALRGVFEAGEADWTKVREAAQALAEGYGSDEDWAPFVVESSYDEVCARVEELKGDEPTARLGFKLSLQVIARFEQYVNSTGERLGQRLTHAEAFELMLETAARCEPCPRGQEQEREAEAGSAAEGEAVAHVGTTRIPPASATLVAKVCELCEELRVEGPLGPVVLSPERAALLLSNAVVQDADGRRTRKIPPRIQSLVYVRDAGMCVVPGCGAKGFLQQHHEGAGGWRETGHDPDRIALLCLGHHTQRHKGLLKLEPLGGGRFRCRGADGRELVAAPGANGRTTCPRGQEAPETS